MKKANKNLMCFISEYNVLLSLFALYVFMTHALEIQNCIVKLLLGYPCPGCGMSRAAFALMRFDFAEAFRYNPFIYLFPFAVFGIAFKDNNIIQKWIKKPLIWSIILIVIILTYILRFIFIYPNAPMDYYPNNLLAFIFSLFKKGA